MNRAMFVTVLARLEGIDPSKYTSSNFSDVPPDAYYLGGVEWASSVGIVNGMGDGTFGSEKEITREQMATLIYRYIQYKGYTLPTKVTAEPFADGNKISSYAKDAVTAMQNAGILNGKGENKFDPQGTAKRGEVAKIFAMLIEVLVKQS